MYYHPEGFPGPAPQESHRQPETASFSAAYISPPAAPYNVGHLPPHNTFFTYAGAGTLASPVLIDPPEPPGPVPRERPRQPETTSFSAPYISPPAGPYDVGRLASHDTFFEGTRPGTSVLPALIRPPEPPGPVLQERHQQPKTASSSATYASPLAGPYNVGHLPPHDAFFGGAGPGTSVLPALNAPPELDRKRKAVPDSLLSVFGSAPKALRRSTRPEAPVRCPPGFFNDTSTDTRPFRVPENDMPSEIQPVGHTPHSPVSTAPNPWGDVRDRDRQKTPSIDSSPVTPKAGRPVPEALNPCSPSSNPENMAPEPRPKCPLVKPARPKPVPVPPTVEPARPKPVPVPTTVKPARPKPIPMPMPVERPKPIPVPMPVEMSNTYQGPPPARPKPAPESTSPEMPTAQEPKLCPEQAALVELIASGRNVFYTGSAGCGKSTVLRAFVARLRAMGKTVRILAPTGRAALQVNGTTTWSYAGWTPNSHKMTLDELKTKAHGKIVWGRFSRTDVLVIDEISMVENLHFERLNQVMKDALWEPKSGQEQKPFGGVQVVVTGDFCQLPPVKPFQHCMVCGKETIEGSSVDGSVYRCPNPRHEEFRETDKWAFMSKAWQECGFTHVHLNTIHRQSDQTFIRLLQKCRIGVQLHASEIDLLMNHECQVHHATKLYATRDEVNKVNQAAFDKLTGLKHSYWCRDTFVEKHLHLSWKGVRKGHGPMGQQPLEALNDHRFGERVELKPGMLVVLLANIDLQSGLCNGSQGIVCGFVNYAPQLDPMVKKAKAVPGEEPVRKEQDGPRTYGDYSSLQEKEIQGFINGPGATFRKWPVVKFHNGIRRAIYAECSITELGDEKPYSLLCRTQIPLAPAWAMTIHKSQSLTLDRVIVNLSKAFEKGQVYVALSRATSLDGLKIEGDAEGLRKGLGGNREVQRFLREKFGALNG